MKITPLFLMLIFPLALFSQNWQAVNPDYTYFYSDDLADLIEHTVKTDSISDATGHPVYYLNTVVMRCDTCYTPVPCFQFQFDDPHLTNIQGVFAKEIHQLENGRYWFFDSLSFVIHTKAGLTQSWVFDTTKNITAEITALSWLEVFPAVSDSVKTILLSNGTEIMLSKNYGLLSFPSQEELAETFHLQGLKTLDENRGNTPAGFWEIFDIEVGDVFQYDEHAGVSGPPPNSEHYTRKVTITSKEQSENTVSFGQHIIKRGHMYGGLDVYDETVSYTNTPEFLANQLPGTLYDHCADDQSSSGMCDNYIPYSIYSEIHQVQSFCNIVAIANYDEQDEAKLLVECEVDIMVNEAIDRGNIGRAYASGLGLVRKMDIFFGQYNRYQIEAYVKNGDTIGSITPDEILLDVDEVSNGMKIQLHPNPAKQSVFLDASENVEVWIFDLKGQLMFNRQFVEPSNEIDLRTFSPGVYFLKMLSGEKSYTEKLIVQ